MTEFTTLIQTFGLAVSILIVIGLFFWRIVVWMKPWVEKVVTAHVDLVRDTGVAMKANSATVSEIGRTQARQEATLSQLAKTIETQGQQAICKYRG